jgi:hypothetical protein
MGKTKISNINPKEFLDFFKSSKLGAGQTFDFTSQGVFCKSANKNKTNIIYREFIFNPIQVPKLVGQLRLFIYDVSGIIKVLDRFKDDEVISITLDHDDVSSAPKEGFNENSGDSYGQVKKFTVSSDSVNFDIYSSESAMGVGTYIPDALYASIKTVKDPSFKLNITDKDISKMLKLHAITKSENEVYNIISIKNDDGKLVFSHKSHENQFDMTFDDKTGLEFCKLDGQFDVSLEIFSNINKNKELVLEAQVGQLTALFLSSNGMQNISVMVKK